MMDEQDPPQPIVVPEPITVQDAKSFLRVTHGADDALITSLIKRARLLAEKLTGRTIVKASLLASWDYIPGGPMPWWDGQRDGAIGMFSTPKLALPRPPLISVTSVTGYNDDDSAVLLPDNQYRVDNLDPDLAGRVCLKMGATWPVFTRPSDGFQVEFIAGYEVVPEDLKHAILLMTVFLYQNRGCSDAACASGAGVTNYLNQFVVVKVT